MLTSFNLTAANTNTRRQYNTNTDRREKQTDPSRLAEGRNTHYDDEGFQLDL